MKLGPKVALFAGVLTCVPILVVGFNSVRDVEKAVFEQEVAAQRLMATRVGVAIDRRIGSYYDDAYSVAVTLSYLGGDSGPDALNALQGVVASRLHIPFARLEIPSAKIDTVLGKKENDASLAPRASEEARGRADVAGVDFTVVDETRGAITVVVPPPPDGSPSKVKAYVTVPVYLRSLDEDLEGLTTSLGMTDANVVVFDTNRYVLASTGSWAIPSGPRPAENLFFDMVPEGLSLDDVEMSTPERTFRGERYVATLVTYRADNADVIGGADRKSRFGFAAGVARTEAAVYGPAREATRRVAFSAASVLVVSLAAAFFLSRSVTRPVLRLRGLAERIAVRDYDAVVAGPPRSDEIGELDRGIVKMAHDLRAQEETIRVEIARRADLSRFMDSELVNRIIRGEQSLELGGKRMMVTVLFADVVAFTPFAESRPAEQVVGLLNELFTILSEVVFRHHGLVDKFIGDCIMAVFGAPVPQEDHAERALLAAEDMMRFLETVSDTWREKYDVEVRLGIGIHSGEAIVGNVGSEKRMEYTVVGDVANVASRLETIARPNQILLSEETKKMTERRFPFKILGPQKLTGRKSAVTVYELEVG